MERFCVVCGKNKFKDFDFVRIKEEEIARA